MDTREIRNEVDKGPIKAGCLGILIYMTITLLTIVLALLKYFDAIGWSWLVVFLPFIVVLSILVLFFMVGLLMVFLPKKSKDRSAWH